MKGSTRGSKAKTYAGIVGKEAVLQHTSTIYDMNNDMGAKDNMIEQHQLQLKKMQIDQAPNVGNLKVQILHKNTYNGEDDLNMEIDNSRDKEGINIPSFSSSTSAADPEKLK